MLISCYIITYLKNVASLRNDDNKNIADRNIMCTYCMLIVHRMYFFRLNSKKKYFVEMLTNLLRNAPGERSLT